LPPAIEHLPAVDDDLEIAGAVELEAVNAGPARVKAARPDHLLPRRLAGGALGRLRLGREIGEVANILIADARLLPDQGEPGADQVAGGEAGLAVLASDG